MKQEFILLSPTNRMLTKDEVIEQANQQGITFELESQDYLMLFYEAYYTGMDHWIKQSGFKYGSGALWFAIPLDYFFTILDETKHYNEDQLKVHAHGLARTVLSTTVSYIGLIVIIKSAALLTNQYIIMRLVGCIGIVAGLALPFVLGNLYSNDDSIYDLYFREHLDSLYKSIKAFKDSIKINITFQGQDGAMRGSAMECAKELQQEFNLTKQEYNKLWRDLYNTMKQVNQDLHVHKITVEEADEIYFDLLEEQLELLVAKKEKLEQQHPKDKESNNSQHNHNIGPNDTALIADNESRMPVNLPEYIDLPLEDGQFPDMKYYYYNADKNRFELFPAYRSAIVNMNS